MFFLLYTNFCLMRLEKALCLSIRRVNACMDKVETHVKFPLRNLDLRSFLSKSEEEVSCHFLVAWLILIFCVFV